MKGIIDIGLYRLLAAYFFVLVFLAIMRRRRIGREKDLLISVFRMTVQLVLAGYILEFLFGTKGPWFTLLVLAAMETFAVRNVFQRVKQGMPPGFRRVVIYALSTGSLISLGYFIVAVVGLTPWYEPRYIIPLAGMIIGNSMTGIALGAERLLDGVRSKRDLVEGALMLGATPEDAVRDIANGAFYAAILPTINSMVGMGIVFLPGMMTGQILSGVSPLTAINYQIAIMLGILGSVSLTVFVLVTRGARALFNDRAQLILPDNSYQNQ